uniref:Uncharacterized protein n=1 Tax=Meloidogyne incognita TaxID=6306 RepID=A0A914KWI9_MELIC
MCEQSHQLQEPCSRHENDEWFHLPNSLRSHQYNVLDPSASPKQSIQQNTDNCIEARRHINVVKMPAPVI